MKKIFLLFLFLQLCKPIVALAQLNASQIKKDGVTIKGNASNQLMVDTSNVATKWYAASVGGGGGGIQPSDTAAMLSPYLRTNTASGLYFNIANNLSEGTAGTMRTNLGLGTLATQSGTFSGTSSGTNTGDQTITLTGDVTGSGTGSFATTIANSAVTNAMLAGSIDLTTKVTGALPIANGGTASTTAAGARASLLTMFTVVMVNTVGTLVQNTTYYFGAQGNAANTAANRRFKKIPFACTLRGATVTMTSSNSPSTENNTVVLSINNGATNVTISSTFASGATNCTSTHYTGFTQAIGAGDTIEIKYTTNATLATAPANCGLVVDLYFE